MNIQQERADFERHWHEFYKLGTKLARINGRYLSPAAQWAWEAWQARAALQSQDREGWKEAAIAWEVCASLHREYCKGKDPFFKARQADFVKHAEASREKALGPSSAEDKTDAERYRWLRNSAGFLALPYVDHGAGPEFPSGSELDAAIDHARRAEGDGG